MMVALLLYAYCVGLPSSRKIKKATYHLIPFRVLTANQHPDHDTIAVFRKRHLHELAQLFVAVLRLCQQAGLVKLGHVSLDGTKVRANASRHKAMSYGRMDTKIAELETQVEQLLKEAEACDQQEDALYGKGKRGDQLPKQLQFRKSRLKRIREDNCRFLQTEHIDVFIATEKTNNLANSDAPRGGIPKNASITERMTRKLQTIKGRLVYAKRKHIVEPVFGQIKEAKHFVGSASEG